jgi:hypothetical protein
MGVGRLQEWFNIYLYLKYQHEIPIWEAWVVWALPLSPLWPGFDSRSRSDMWVGLLLILSLASRGVLRFSSLRKIDIPKFLFVGVDSLAVTGSQQHGTLRITDTPFRPHRNIPAIMTSLRLDLISRVMEVMTNSLSALSRALWTSHMITPKEKTCFEWLPSMAVNIFSR